jgi:hypothetical protein
LAWQGALQAGQPEEAWSFLASDAREGLEQKAFVAMYQRHAPALIRQANAMVDWARSHPPAEVVEVEVGGRRVPLVWTRDGWRIDGGVGGSLEVDSTPE